MWVLPKCFGTTHTRWWYSGGGQGIPLMPYSSPSHKRTSGAAAPSTCCDAFRELWPWGECNLPTNVQNSPTRRWHQISPPCYSKLVIYKNKSVSWKHVSRDLFTQLSFMPLLLCSGKRKKSNFSFHIFMVIHNSWKGPVSVDVTLAPCVYIITSGCRLRGADVVL